MSKVGVGVVGAAGRLAAIAHGNALLANEHARIVAICDTDREGLEARAREWNVPRYYVEYQQLLDDGDVEVVDIVTPPHLHAPMAVQAALAGKHVIVEKPMCTSLREADAMLEAARGSSVKLMVAESYVFLSTHIRARQLMETGEIGEPVHIRQMKGRWVARSGQIQLSTGAGGEHPWRLDPVRSGGGDYPWLMDHAVHFFAAARYLMNDAEITKVLSLSRPWQGAGREGLRDVVAIAWQYEGEDSYGVWSRADEMTGAFDHLGFRTEIFGTKGMIRVLGEGAGPRTAGARPAPLVLRKEGSTSYLDIDEGEDWWWDSVVNYYDRAHRNEIDHFIDCVSHDRTPRYVGEDGRKDLQCTLAAIRSAMEERPIDPGTVPLDWTAYGASTRPA